MLSRPLAETLSPKTPLPNAIRSREATTIDGTTEPRVYTYSLAQTPQNQLALVFKPLPA
jgi:hypothetical protein